MDVRAALSAERTALLGFIGLLEQEQALLVENSTESLLDLSEKKTHAALQLNQLIDARRSYLQAQISELSANSVREWLSLNAPAAVPLWNEIIELGTRAQRTNQTNGELIQMKLRTNQQFLSVLNNAVNKANLYGPNGQPSFAPGSGRSLGSG